MNNSNAKEKVLVQVVSVGGRREIGWGSSTAEELRNRLEDIRSAIAEGAKAVADSLEGLHGCGGLAVGGSVGKVWCDADSLRRSDPINGFRRSYLRGDYTLQARIKSESFCIMVPLI